MEVKKYITLFFCLFLQTGQIYAGGSIIDSLTSKLKETEGNDRVTILNELSREYWSFSLEKSYTYALKALELATTLNDKKGIANAHNRLGNAEYLNTNYQEALIQYNRSLEKRKEINDQYGILGSYNNLYLLHDILGNKEKISDYIKKAVELSIKMGDKSEIAHFLNIQGAINSELHDFDNALTDLERAMEIYTETDDIEGIAGAFNNMGRMYQRMSLYDKAQECFYEALSLYEETGNINGIATVNNNIGITHEKIKNFDIALEYYNKSLELYEGQDAYRTATASVLNNIGIVWFEKGDYGTAMDYYSRALEVYENYKDIQGITKVINNKGLAHTRLGNYQDALELYRKSVDINKTTGTNYSLANNYNNLGELYLLKNNFDTALEYLDKGLEIAVNMNAKELISENYLFRSTIYKERDQYEKALVSYRQFNAYRDSIFTEDTGNRIAELQVRYKKAGQASELKLLQNDKNIQKLRLQRQWSIISLLGIITVIALLFGLIIMSMYRYRIRLNHSLNEKTRQLENAHIKLTISEKNLESLNKTKDKFLSIIAHDLKNPFNVLLGFSETLNQKYNDLSREQIYTYIDIINESATGLYQLLENLLEWSKSQTGNIKYNPVKFQVKELTDREISDLMPATDKKNIIIQSDISPHITAFADKNIISKVIRNLLNNAVKFTFNNGAIVISAKERKKHIEISITDNGIGISNFEKIKLFNLDYNITTTGTNGEKGTGLGLLLCKEYVEKSGGTIWVNSKPGEGSTFTFTIPL